MSMTSGGSTDEPEFPPGRPPEPTRELPVDPTIGTPVYWGPPPASTSAAAPPPPSSPAASPPPPQSSAPYPPLPTYPGPGDPGSWGSPPGPPNPPAPLSQPGSTSGRAPRPSYGGVIAAAVALALVAGRTAVPPDGDFLSGQGRPNRWSASVKHPPLIVVALHLRRHEAGEVGHFRKPVALNDPQPKTALDLLCGRSRKRGRG